MLKLKRSLHMRLGFHLIVCLLSVFGVPQRAVAGKRVVRVGVYQNNPKVFIDDSGVPMGIFVDVLEEIARLEGWNLRYFPGTWSENLQRLRESEIDLLVDVAQSADRVSEFHFSRGWVLESWIDVYTLENRRIRRVADLAGKTIAVLRGSIQEQYLSGEFQTVFGLRYTIQSLPDYAATVDAVRSGRADALVASRFFYFSPLKDPAIVPNHLILYPGGLYIAFCKNGCEDLVPVFDEHLARMKNDFGSVYYRSLERWLKTPEVRTHRIPRWVWWINLAVFSLLILAGMFSLLLRRQVRVRTRELSEANARLTAVNRELDEKISELKQSHDEQEKLHQQIARIRKLESIGQLAGGIAHDFNNMIGVILGSVELAREALGPDSPALEELEEIRGAAQRSAELTRRLLAFARQQPAQPRIVDLNVSISGIVSMLRRLIGEHLLLEFLPGEDLPPVFIDPSQVDQILTNLVVNARDAISGSGTITIETGRQVFPIDDSCTHRATGVEGVLLKVGDNGCGMPPELIERIFDPFFTTKPQGEGTGLGLATVFGIVAQNHGCVTVDSLPGEGTTISILLPAHDPTGNQTVTKLGEKTGSP